MNGLNDSYVASIIRKAVEGKLTAGQAAAKLGVTRQKIPAGERKGSGGKNSSKDGRGHLRHQVREAGCRIRRGSLEPGRNREETDGSDAEKAGASQIRSGPSAPVEKVRDQEQIEVETNNLIMTNYSLRC